VLLTFTNVRKSQEHLETAVKEMVGKFGKKRYIANLGHGIYPDMDPESVKILIDTIHSF
jgi:uroporphyrinogen decarboxylase